MATFCDTGVELSHLFLEGEPETENDLGRLAHVTQVILNLLIGPPHSLPLLLVFLFGL